MRDALAPFRVALSGMLTSPGKSLRSLRDYSFRLLGYLSRNRQILWRVAIRDKSVLGDSNREANLCEYLDRR
jgi:hypothetical protein